MARQFAGAASDGHFFDDIGRSGQISLRHGLAGIRNTPGVPSPPMTASERNLSPKYDSRAQDPTAPGSVGSESP